MNLPGLIKVDGADLSLIERLSDMAGESFLEEPWTKLLLDELPPTEEKRRVALYQALMRCDITYAAPVGAVYCLEDALGNESALAIAYQKSELRERYWAEIEKRGAAFFERVILHKEEKKPFRDQLKAMEPISDFSWEENESPEGDFIHFVCLAVAKKKQGSGTFRKLMEPFFTHADRYALPCYLETYSDRLQSLYEHLGFELIRVLDDPSLPISERCMVRKPEIR